MEFVTDIGAKNRHVVKVNFDNIDTYEVVASESKMINQLKLRFLSVMTKK
jgi:hypothetical protein